jgi:hypothetical protein
LALLLLIAERRRDGELWEAFAMRLSGSSAVALSDAASVLFPRGVRAE